MAGMGIGTGIFSFVTFLVLVRQSPERSLFRGLLRTPFAYASLLFFLLAALSLLVAALDPPLTGALPGFKELAKFHYFLVPFWVALAFLANSRGQDMESEKFFRFLAYAALFNSVLAAVQFFARDLLPDSWLDARFFRGVGSPGAAERFHAQGIMMFHLSFASCMSFVAALGLARLFFPLANDSLKQKIFWTLVGLGGALATFYSFSRIAWVAILVIPILLAFLKKPKWGLLSVLVAGVLAVSIWFGSEMTRKRWEYSINGIHERQQMWAAAVEMAKDRPVLGVGFGRSGHYSEPYATRALGYKPEFTSHAHNNFLDMLAAMGWLGLGVFLFWWTCIFAMAWSSFRQAPTDRRWLPAAAMAGFVAFHINGLTQVNFWDGKSQHTLMLWVGLTLALWMRDRLGPVEKGQILRCNH